MELNDEKVNGVRILKTYTAASAFSGILSILLVAVPILFIFFPWLEVSVSGGQTYSLNAIELIKVAYIGETNELTAFISSVAQNNQSGINNIDSIWGIFSTVNAGIFIALCLFSAVNAIIGFVYIFAGRTRKANSGFRFSILTCVLTILFSGLGIAFEMILKVGFESYNDAIVNIGFIIPLVAIIIGFVLTSGLGLINSYNFKGRVYVSDLNEKEYVFKRSDLEQNNVNTPQPAEERIELFSSASQEKKPNALPSNITFVAGHQFSGNQDLETAIIPKGIKTLGVGAFSNCGKLHTVSLPRSLKVIGGNCFFNCAALTQINYRGTKKEWKQIKRGSNWLFKAGTTKVVCTDGAILVDPYR